MLFADAVKLKKGDIVQYINGRNEPTTKHTIVDIEREDKNVFIRCDDGKLYHHTAFKNDLRTV